MKAWAIMLTGNKTQRIVCVFAKTEDEAFGKAYHEINEELEKENNDLDKISDYKVTIWTSANFNNEIQNDSQEKTLEKTFSQSTSSEFENQIRSIRS